MSPEAGNVVVYEDRLVNLTKAGHDLDVDVTNLKPQGAQAL
jgi:hypothetical protein